MRGRVDERPPAASQEPVLAEDSVPVIKAPLTDGFARTGYEQDLIAKAEALKPKE